jgi:hypothetical protein
MWFERFGDNPQRWIGELDPARISLLSGCTWQLPQTGAVLWRKSALEALVAGRKINRAVKNTNLFARTEGQPSLRFRTHIRTLFTASGRANCLPQDPAQPSRPHRLLDEARDWLKERGRWTDHTSDSPAARALNGAHTRAR